MPLTLGPTSKEPAKLGHLNFSKCLDSRAVQGFLRTFHPAERRGAHSPGAEQRPPCLGLLNPEIVETGSAHGRRLGCVLLG